MKRQHAQLKKHNTKLKKNHIEYNDVVLAV